MLQQLLGRLTGGMPALSPRARVEPVLATAEAPSRPTAAAPDSGVQHPEQWFLTSLGRASAAGVRVTEDTALTLTATIQALRILTGVFAMAPWHYYARTAEGRTRALNSPIYRLFHDRPNGTQSPFAFRELLLGDVLLAGNFFAYVSRDRWQNPVALTRLDPLQVQVAEYFDRGRGLELFYDATLPDGSRERFSARDIWHVAGFTRDGIMGLNPVRYMREALGAAIATGEYAGRFWANDAKPSVVLTTSQKVDKATKEQIKADWNARFAGAANAHATAVLDQDLKPEVIQADHEKSQFIETRTFQVLELARCWGVPPHLIFELSRATFGNIEQQSLELVTYHLGPHWARAIGAADRDFAEDGHYFEALTDALVKGDIKSRWEAYRIQREMGVRNADEIRDRENDNRIGGRAGTEYWRPANMHISGTDPTSAGLARPAPTQQQD